MKHAILLQLIARLKQEGPLTVLDTHAGAGAYELESEAARRSGEAERGVKRLMSQAELPAVLAPLAKAVRAANATSEIRLYPGSPTLILGALGPGDRYVGCELDQAAHDRLVQTIRPLARARGVGVEDRLGDGYAEAERLADGGARALAFVDPPFERGDDYGRILSALSALRRNPHACAAVWAPLKDLETFDALLRGMELLGPRQALVAQVRLRPLTDPMRMNGCAMILAGAPDLAQEALAICTWVADRLGEPGGSGRVFRLDD